jgi:hypothetical protein
VTRLDELSSSQVWKPERIREHYRAALARVAVIDPDSREAEVRVVREVAAARRRSAA